MTVLFAFIILGIGYIIIARIVKINEERETARQNFTAQQLSMNYYLRSKEKGLDEKDKEKAIEAAETYDSYIVRPEIKKRAAWLNTLTRTAPREEPAIIHAWGTGSIDKSDISEANDKDERAIAEAKFNALWNAAMERGYGDLDYDDTNFASEQKDELISVDAVDSISDQVEQKEPSPIEVERVRDPENANNAYIMERIHAGLVWLEKDQGSTSPGK